MWQFTPCELAVCTQPVSKTPTWEKKLILTTLIRNKIRLGECKLYMCPVEVSNSKVEGGEVERERERERGWVIANYHE